MIEAKELHFSYGKRQILNGVSLSVDKGSFICVLGANGCGKTTLLKNLLGFLTPESGSVLVDGQDIVSLTERELSRKIAYIPQIHTPPFPYTVEDVVLLGRTPHMSRTFRPTAADREIASAAMERLGILQFAKRSYTRLSGGQRQMVIIARALTQQPDLLIMDEPTASLDFGNQYLVLAQMVQLAQEGMGVLMVTHNPEHAIYCADRIVAMRDGIIIADGVPSEVVNETTMQTIYNMDIKVRELSLSADSSVTVCVPLPDIRHGANSCNMPLPRAEAAPARAV